MAKFPSYIEKVHGVLAMKPGVLELDHAWDATGIYSHSQTWPKLPEDFYCEMIDGHIISPVKRDITHQLFFGSLTVSLPDNPSLEGVVVISPFDVILSDKTVVQPDLIYVSSARLHQIRDWLFGTPDIAIEIISPEFPRRDRVFKKQLYERFEIPEYWLFDPVNRTAEFFVLENRKYEQVIQSGDLYESPNYHEIPLNLKKLWKLHDKRFPKAR